MSNKLKNVFSNKSLELGGTFHFQNEEAQKSFFSALEIVQNEGKAVEVKGILSIDTNVKDGDMIYPMKTEENPSSVIVTPSYEKIPTTIYTAKGDIVVNLYKYRTNNDIILETSKNEIVFLKFTFPNNGDNIQLSYQMQPQFIQNTKQVIESYCIALGLLKYVFKPDKQQVISERIVALQSIIKSFQVTYLFWKKLGLVEDALGLSFDPTKLENISDIVRDVEELYLLIVEKKIIRSDQKLTSIENMGISYEQEGVKLPEIGDAIVLSFLSKMKSTICGEKIVIYTANLVVNAVVKDILKGDNDTTKILYGDTDNMPMNIFYSGFLTEEEAEEEHKHILGHSGPKPKYLEAISLNEYLKQEKSL